MSTEQRERLARDLLALSEEMLALAEAEEWPGLADKEAARGRLVAELFATPVPPEAAPVVADCLRRVLELDQVVMGLADTGRRGAANALTELRAGKQAQTAYGRFAR